MATKIYNLTQHTPTSSQVAAGVVEFPGFPNGVGAYLNVDTKGLSALGQSYLDSLALHAIHDLIVPALIRQAEAFCLGEWQCGSENTGAPLTGVTAFNALRDAQTVHVMIAGQPDLIETIRRLAPRGVVFHTSLTERTSVEVHNPDGTVTKTNVFEHAGFFPPVG